ncbi:MAG: hypothetical protein ACPGSG_05650 [Prolixibacteraceae bacterium]
MISEIIQKQLTQSGFDSYSILYNNAMDQLPTHEILIHTHEQLDVHQDKDGIYGIQYLVTINICGTNPDIIENMQPNVTKSILDIQDTKVIESTLRKWDSIDYEEASERYFSSGEFILEVTNNI